MTAESTIAIRRPPQDVFAFLADPRNDPLWCTRAVSVEPAGDGEYRVLHKPLRLQPKPYELRMRLLATRRAACDGRRPTAGPGAKEHLEAGAGQVARH